MALKAGELNRRILFERNTQGRDSAGNQEDSWAVLGRAWAKVMYGTGQERREAAQESATTPATFRVRRSAVTLSLTAADRLRFDPAGGAPDDAPLWDIAGAVPFGNDGVDITAVRRTAAD
ncbi:MAG: phage head closure protein [Allosphingosinicella sp.]